MTTNGGDTLKFRGDMPKLAGDIPRFLVIAVNGAAPAPAIVV